MDQQPPDNSPTPEQIRSFVDSLNAEGEVTNEKRNAWNLKEAYDVLSEKIEGDDHFGESAILDFHAIIARDAKDSRTGNPIPKGAYSKGIRTIENTLWQPKPSTHPSQIPAEMRKFGQQLDAYMRYRPEDPRHAIHVIDHAAEIMVRLVDIHPFADGNGRVSRLLADGILMAGDLYQMAHWLGQNEYEFARKQAEFFVMMEQARQYRDFRLLHHFMTRQQLNALNMELAAISSNTQAATEAEMSGYLDERKAIRNCLEEYEDTLVADLEKHSPKPLPARTTTGHPPQPLTHDQRQNLMQKFSFLGNAVEQG